VEFATPDLASGQCVQAIGDWHIDIYDKNGNFSRVIPGL
jgi:hypothetical protein